MPSIQRRHLLVGSTTLAIGLAAGVTELFAGPSPTFTADAPAPGSWPMPRYGSRNTAHNPHAAIPRDEPTVAWQATGRVDVESLVVDAETVFAGGRTGVTALDVDTGTEQWSTTAGAWSLCVHGGSVYALSRRNGVVTALDAATGQTRWQVETGRDSGHYVLAADDVVYAGLHGLLVAFDATTGERLWAVDVGGLGRVGTAIAHGRLYAGGPGPTEAFEPRDGIDAVRHPGPRRLWRGVGPAFGYPPAVSGDTVLVGSEDVSGRVQAVHAHDATAGETRWTTPLERVTPSPAVADGIGFVGATAPRRAEADLGRLVALDLDDGEPRWSRPLSDWASDPVVAGGVVAVGVYANVGHPGSAMDSPVSAFDAMTGERLWTRGFAGDTHRLAAIGETLYVGTRGGGVFALRAT